jgi:hypothetical protein
VDEVRRSAQAVDSFVINAQVTGAPTARPNQRPMQLARSAQVATLLALQIRKTKILPITKQLGTRLRSRPVNCSTSSMATTDPAKNGTLDFTDQSGTSVSRIQITSQGLRSVPWTITPRLAVHHHHGRLALQSP